MSELDRDVAGLTCREVLENLSAYVDGDLTDDQVRQVEGHLRGCDRCERFGGGFSHVVTALRRELGAAEALDAGVSARLRKRLQTV